MTISQPSLPRIFQSLLWADLTVQLRRGRSGLMTIITPLIVLVAWRNIASTEGGSFVIASCIVIGLMSSCLLGYSVAISQDRDKGIFQRLRATPAPVWMIMLSRLVVQLVSVAIMAILVIVVGYYIDNISLGLVHSLFGVLAALFGAMAFLALGQMVVGLVRSTDAVNSASRLIYIPLAFGGAVASLGILGDTAKTIVNWSPYGTVETVLQAALHGSSGVEHLGWSLLATVGYTVLFTTIGIRYFQWASE